MKEEENHDLNNQQTELDLSRHLQDKGVLYYVSENIDLAAFSNYIIDKIKNELKFETSYDFSQNIHTIKYKGKGGISGSFGFTNTFHLFFTLKDDKKLFLDLQSEKWFKNGEEKFSIGQWFRTSKYNEIKHFIYDYLVENTIGTKPSLKIHQNNHYVNEISDKKKMWFYANSEANDIMLAFLQLSTQQGNNNSDKDLSWYFLISSNQTKLLAFNKREELTENIDCEIDTFKVNKEMGRNRFMCNDRVFLCHRSNNDMFYALSNVDLSTQIQRTREIARLNWLHSEADDDTKLFVLGLLKQISADQHILEDEISILYIDYTQKNKDELFSSFTENNQLLQLLDRIVISSNISKQLISWVERWKISYVDAAAINDLMLYSVENAVQANNTLEFHRFVHKQFFKHDKDKINRIWFDINFSKHLIKSGLLAEAKKILNKNLKHLPDENMSDLVPAKYLDLTGSSSGQILKVSILELLIGIEAEKNAIKYKAQLARLQPLVELRLDELIKVSEQEFAQKAEALKNIMLPEALANTEYDNHTQEAYNYNYEVIDPKILDKHIKYHLGKKNEHFTKFQKWVATVKTNDYEILKSYSEQLNSDAYPDLYQITQDITNALNISDLEVYIARGEKASGIRSFEGEPNFLLVGVNHLEPQSGQYLTPLELRYAVAGELAHLYFKHARVTSNDIWRGAIDKGTIVLDTLLTLIPAVSLFGKSMQGLGKLNSISSFLQTTKKAGKISDTSKNILTASDQLMKIYQSKKEKDEVDKEREFWATARIIQSRADRCALIFTKNIKAAVRSILIMSKIYNSEISNIEQTGLREYLLQTTEDGNFKNQELAIRLSNLFSFYLSEDYKNIISKIKLKNYSVDNKEVSEKD